jgi:hypothetical protein
MENTLTTKKLNTWPILVVSFAHLRASVMRFFDSLPNDVRPLVRIVFAGDVAIKLEVIQAQAVVFVNDLTEYDDLITFARRIRLPIYHFCDGDHAVPNEEIVLYNPPNSLPTFDKLRHRLKDFTGCLLSTPNLVDFYRQNALHSNLYLFPPISSLNEYGPAPHDYPNTRPFTLAVFGETKPADAFTDYVVPAIKRLSKSRAIDLIAFGVDVDAIDCKDFPNLRVFYPPFEPDYALAIRQFRHYAPNVVLFPCLPSRNNVYKNCSAIIDGVLVGAAIVCSGTAPYLGLDEASVALLASDTVDSWYLAIWQFTNSDKRLSQFKCGAKDYCTKMYDGIQNGFVIKAIINATAQLDDDELAARWVLALQYIEKCNVSYEQAVYVLAEEERRNLVKLADGQMKQHDIRTELHLNAQRIAAKQSEYA